MDERSTADDAATLARIREQLRSSLAHAPLPPPTPRPELRPNTSREGIEAELSAMQATSDILDARAHSYRAWLGPVLERVRRIAGRVLAPTFERQVGYNVAATRLAAAFSARIQTLEEEQEVLRRSCEALGQEIAALRAAARVR
jgi:hypothetical protein